MSSALALPAGRRVNVCFHGVDRPRRALEHGENKYWVSHDEFLRLADAFATWDALSLSFDDGNVSDVEIVLPALVERGMTATFFVLAGRLDQPGSLTTGDVQELVEAGMTVGSHGWTHTPWTRLDGVELDREVIDARDLIAEITGAPVTTAALPLGQYNRAVLKAARHAGYSTLFTSDRQTTGANSWRQARFSVQKGTTPESLTTAVATALETHRRVYSTLKQFRKSWS
ncbi:polysaccharide deacetylase family protein [Flexivirga oryzae]|uniref:Peptidoglycan/xylan/chitin deacetylase (PgdA/CDA1 family) n=1 Tax=Flexivirga oryzae TaxID=1794944 RepID=A0A839MXN2_9MICO|nr:polysaccharide deacetylase family protein [Flexivirga oryzae]MBB2890148.1 peptidoglycan/xylan/chitin deacetylase (PgdA/CDA1 family) [Flexivirga oryzae]